MSAFTSHHSSLGRRRVLAALAAVCISLPLAAQETPQEIPLPEGMGFFRLVNAVGLAGKLKVRVDGTEADPEGFKEGYATGSVGLLPKSYQVELEHETLGKQSLQVSVQTGQISTVIAYKDDKPDKDAKKSKATKGEAEKAGPHLGWYVDQAPVSPPKLKDPKLTLLQLTPATTIDFKVSGTPAPAPAGKPFQIPVTRSMGSFPEVQLNGKAVCLLNFDVPADQLVIFFGGEDGNLKHAQLRNDVQ